MSVKKIVSVDYIVIHCAATKPSMDIGVEEIDRWHRQRGFFAVGYHKVIRRDGTIEDGRAIDVRGAHAKGFNSRSIGICLAGGVSQENANKAENNFTDAQFDSLKYLIKHFTTKFPNAEVLGHRDLPNVNKDCPSFDVRKWRGTGTPEV
jgi:N-acetylmuramoyl-L-alanine amidase